MWTSKGIGMAWHGQAAGIEQVRPWDMQVHPNEEYMIVAAVQGVGTTVQTVIPNISRTTFVSVRLQCICMLNKKD